MPLDQTVSAEVEAGKTRAIIAHITLIGWIIALVQNNSDKNEFASFYIRQMLGLLIIAVTGSILGSFIAIAGTIIHIGALILWILSIMGATKGEKSLTPGLGVMFQDWFKAM